MIISFATLTLQKHGFSVFLHGFMPKDKQKIIFYTS